MPINSASISSPNPPSLQEQLYARMHRKMDVSQPNPITIAKSDDEPYIHGGIAIPHPNPGKCTPPDSIISNDSLSLTDARPEQSSLSSAEGVTKFCPVTHLPQQQAQMFQPTCNGARFMYLSDTHVGQQHGRMLQSPQQAHHMQYKTGITTTQQQQIHPQLYMPHNNPYLHHNMPKFDNQTFSVAEGNSIAISKQIPLTGGLKVSVYPSLHEFGDGGKGERSEAVRGFSSKPEIIMGGTSSHSVHDSNHCVATTATTNTTGSGGIVSINHLIKNPVPPESAWNSSTVAGKKNYTVVSHYQGKHGGISVSGAGAGQHDETSGKSDGSRGGAVLGNSQVVDMRASFRNLLSVSPRQAEENMQTLSQGVF